MTAASRKSVTYPREIVPFGKIPSFLVERARNKGKKHKRGVLLSDDILLEFRHRVTKSRVAFATAGGRRVLRYTRGLVLEARSGGAGCMQL